MAVKKKATPKKPQAKQTPRSSDSHSTTNGASTNTHTEPHNVISLPEEPPARWRTVDIQTNIALKRVKGRARLWLPLAQYKDTLWQRSLSHTWEGNFSSASIYRDPVAEMEVFVAEWTEGTDNPKLQIVS